MQNFIKKWKTSLIYMLLPVLLYGILGPLEIYAGNADEFIFILKDFFWLFLSVSLLLWLAGSAVLAFFPEKIRDVLHVVIFIFSILSYVQNLFLNRKLMNVNGSAMDWESMRRTMIINLIVWIVFAGVFAVIPFIWKNRYRKIYLGITAFISAVQLVTVISLLITTIPLGYRLTTVSREGLLETAPGSNVIVLVFDSCYNTQFEETMMAHPEIAETLKDFTYYDNADCHYNFTFPSLVHMLTGVDIDGSIPMEEWKESCWHEERSMNFFNTLHSLDYECDLYSYSYIYNSIGSIENLTDIFDNTIEATPYVNHQLLYVELEKMAIYKYMPYILKPRFEVMDHVIHEIALLELAVGDENRVPHENGEFYQALMEEGLSVDASISNKFSVIHLSGYHFPLNTNADGTYSVEATGLSETSEGVAVVMQEYVRQLKDLEGDVYDNATIIITADHGLNRNTPQPVYFIKPPHASQEEMQITSAPVSHDDFQATVLTCIGQDNTGYGTSVFDWREGGQRRREYWYPAGGVIDGASGYFVYSYDTDRYELMGMSDEEGVFVPYP